MVLPAIAIKMLVGPISAWWVGAQLGLTGDTLKAITIIGAMPVMVISLIIADEFELDVPLMALCIAVSTVLLFVTLPVVMKLLF
jgi:predicted permease